MRAELKAGLAYFAVVLAAGFILGTLRVFVLTLFFSSTVAVIVELPFVLVIAWFACRWTIERFAVPAELQARVVMGGLAFALLIAAELVLSISLFGRTFATHFATYLEPAGAIGLLGQFAFAVFPTLQARVPE